MTFSQFFEAPVTNSCSCQYYLTAIDHSRFSRQTFFDTPVFKSFSRIILQNNMPYFYFLLQPSSALILWNIANGNFQTAMFHPLTQNSSKVPLWYLSAMKDMSSETVTLWLVWNLVGDLADPHIALVSVSFSSLIKKIKSISTVNNDRLAVLIGLNILSHNLLFSWDQSQKYLYIKKKECLRMTLSCSGFVCETLWNVLECLKVSASMTRLGKKKQTLLVWFHRWLYWLSLGIRISPFLTPTHYEQDLIAALGLLLKLPRELASKLFKEQFSS